MASLIFHIIFLFVSIYALFKVIGFAIYEIKEMNNKWGGIIVISFSLLVTIFANYVIWTNWHFQSQFVSITYLLF